MGLGIDQPFAIIIEHADTSNPEHLGNAYGVFPALGIHLLILALLLLSIISGAVATVQWVLPAGVFTMRLLALLCATVAQPLDEYTLELYEDTFVVRSTNSVSRINLVTEKPVAKPSVAYRKNDNYAVWDERGLTIRRGKKVLSSRLTDIVTSPRLFSREEILRTIPLLKAGTRKREAAGISGSARIGTDAFFLVRWEETNEKPWLEALVRVDLAGSSLKGELVGRFAGSSLGQARIDDELKILGGKLGFVARQESTWGVASYDAAKKEFGFQTLGTKLTEFVPLDSRSGLFAESTTYGTQIAGRVDLISGERETWAESRGRLRFLDPLHLTSSVIVVNDGQTALRDAASGAEVSFPAGWIFRSVAGKYVLAYSSEKNPKEARLLDPNGWKLLARWPGDSTKRAGAPRD